MGRKTRPPDQPPRPARPLSEVEAAVRSLSDAELRRLAKGAERLMTAVRWAGLTQNHEDLLLEAIAKALCGERPWPQDVSLEPYFRMTMKSIRANWVKGNRQEELVEANETSDVEGIAQVFELLESREPDPEHVASAREELESVRALFSDDEIETGILGCWGEQLTEKEICAKLGISSNDYHASRRRMERKLQPFRGERQ